MAQRQTTLWTLVAIVLIASGILLGAMVTAYFFSRSASRMSVVSSDYQPLPQKEPSGGLATDFATLSKRFVVIAEQLRPVVVFISSEKIVHHPQIEQERPFDLFRRPFERFFDERLIPQQGVGSGVIVRSDGYILTNHHVVSNARKIQVELDDGRELEARLVGADPKTDLAVIQVDGDHLPQARLGDSGRLQVGEWVVAVGNPFQLRHSVTTGIVSALGRSNVINPSNFEDFIQTDAAINPGNSGGALANLKGEIVGINTAIATRTGAYQGVGFAIPINMARRVMEQLIRQGRVHRGYLGIYLNTVSNDLAKALGLSKKTGVIVNQVRPDTPAARSGLQAGDVILRFQEVEINDQDRFRNLVAATAPGTEVGLQLWRAGDTLSLWLTLGELPEQDLAAVPALVAPAEELGITVVEMDSTLAQRYGYPGQEGVVISAVKAGSLGEREGLQVGDRIRQINRQPVTSVRDYERILERVRAGEMLLFYVQRQAHYFHLPIPFPG